MPKRRDLTGLKFFSLQVIEAQGRDKWSTPLWLCKCDCGTTILVRSCDLMCGDKRSCGCTRITTNSNVPPGEARVRTSNKNRKDGTRSSREWRQRNPEKVREMERKAREKNPLLSRKKFQTYRLNYPERVAAKEAVQAAIRKGIIPVVTSQKCANPACQDFAKQYHHWSYAQEHRLEVIPLCIDCHSGLHSKRWAIDDIKSSLVIIKTI